MAHEGLWEQLEKLDGQATARRAKCRYLTDPDRYVVTMLNTEYVVNLAGREILTVAGSPSGSARLGEGPSRSGAGFLQQLCILAYLINAKDLPLAGKLVGAESLPGGQFFFRGPHSLPTDKLEQAFGAQPDRLYEAAKRFDAKRCEFGDASVQLYVLPRIAITAVVWRSCEEFPARASILFDQTAGAQLPLDALQAAVNLTVEALIRVYGNRDTRMQQTRITDYQDKDNSTVADKPDTLMA